MRVVVSVIALQDVSVAIFISLDAAEMMREQGNEVNCESVAKSGNLNRTPLLQSFDFEQMKNRSHGLPIAWPSPIPRLRLNRLRPALSASAPAGKR
jgi:hypothetical protein